MSTATTVGFAVLWIVTATLLLLVLILYRQVEKAYRFANEDAGASLAPGSSFPTIEVLHEGLEKRLDINQEGEVVAAFVSTSCPACAHLLNDLIRKPVNAPVRVFVHGAGYEEYRDRSNGQISMHWLAHPPDAAQDVGISVYPQVFVVIDGLVTSSKSVNNSLAITRMLQEARESPQTPAGNTN